MGLSLDTLASYICHHSDRAMYWSTIVNNPLMLIHNSTYIYDKSLLTDIEKFVGRDFIMIRPESWLEDNSAFISIDSLFATMHYCNLYLKQIGLDDCFYYQNVITKALQRIWNLILFMCIKYPLLFHTNNKKIHCTYSISNSVLSSKLDTLGDYLIKEAREQRNVFRDQNSKIDITEVLLTVREYYDSYSNFRTSSAATRCA